VSRELVREKERKKEACDLPPCEAVA